MNKYKKKYMMQYSTLLISYNNMVPNGSNCFSQMVVCNTSFMILQVIRGKDISGLENS